MKTPKKRHLAVRQLREFLGLQQSEFADKIGINLESLKSIELGRRKLSESNAQLIVEKTEVSNEWLLANDPNLPMLNMRGQPYKHPWLRSDQTLDHNAYLLRIARMEILQAYALLAMVRDAEGKEAESKKRWPHIPLFRTRLENFVRAEVNRFPEVKKLVFDLISENSHWMPDVTFLYPRDPAIFDLIIDDAKQCKRAYSLYWDALDRLQPAFKKSPLKKRRSRPKRVE
jgi:transcriptional regulator with XRE-family HTH domain